MCWAVLALPIYCGCELAMRFGGPGIGWTWSVLALGWAGHSLVSSLIGHGQVWPHLGQVYVSYVLPMVLAGLVMV